MVTVTMAASAKYLRDVRLPIFFAGAAFVLGTFIPVHTSSTPDYDPHIIISYSLFFIIYYFAISQLRRISKPLLGARLCADCGYMMSKGDRCPECNGAYWFVMPNSIFGKWNKISNMPKLWVSRSELALMIASTLLPLTIGAIIIWNLPNSLTSLQIATVDLGWVLPMGIWIASVALAFWVAGMIRRRADDRRRREQGNM